MLNPERFLKYTLFRIYDWQSNRTAAEGALFAALFGVALILLFNVLAIVLIAFIISGHKLSLPNDVSGGVVALIMSALLIAISYWRWVRGGRLHTLAAEFLGETAVQRRRGKIAIVSYVVISFFLTIGLAIVHAEIHRH